MTRFKTYQFDWGFMTIDSETELTSDGSWYIYRRTRATNVREYATGASNYATNWTGRAGLTYV